MNKQTLNRLNTARFRRWNRGGYAVFASLSLAVSIGVLAFNVSEKSLQKEITAPLHSDFCGISPLDESEQVQEQLADILSETIVVEQTVAETSAAVSNIIYFSNTTNG